METNGNQWKPLLSVGFINVNGFVRARLSQKWVRLPGTNYGQQRIVRLPRKVASRAATRLEIKLT